MPVADQPLEGREMRQATADSGCESGGYPVVVWSNAARKNSEQLRNRKNVEKSGAAISHFSH